MKRFLFASVSFSFAGMLICPAVDPAELMTLRQQYDRVLSERVSVPYEISLRDLKQGYLAGLDRAIGEAKSAGDLPTVLALEGEKTLISLNGTPPPVDEKTPPSLKKLRGIFLEQSSKLEAQRLESHEAIFTPYVARLKELESSLTKADRVGDARAVLEYRENLGSPGAGSGAPVAKGSAQTPRPAGGEVNSLGMAFVPVPGTDVLMCIHETRRQDYAAFAAAAKGVDDSWKTQDYLGEPVGHEDSHPVVGVNYLDAMAFCEWLSAKDGKTFRLPTDQEWSFAAGIGRDEKRTDKSTPESLRGTPLPEYPWGKDFPPKTRDKAGNYADLTFQEKFPERPILDEYSDGFVTSAPVMSFAPNKLGIYDLGGNVWEWVADWYNAEQKDRALRGSSFGDASASETRTTWRARYVPTVRANPLGFRVVMEVE